MNNVHFFSNANEYKEMYAEIIIPLTLPKNYIWQVPAAFSHLIQPGSRVEVSLKNKKYAGIVKKLSQKKPDSFHPKPIENIIDSEPLISAQHLSFWEWISQYYLCSEGEVMQAALPSHLKLNSETILIWNEFRSEDFSDLDNQEFIVAEALSLRKQLRLSEVHQLLDTHQILNIIKELIAKQVCFVWEELRDKYKEKTDTYILLHSDYQREEKLAELLNQKFRSAKQLDIILAFIHLMKTEGEVTQRTLLEKAKATSTQVKSLVEKNILRTEQRSVNRIKTLPPSIQIDFTLSAAQQSAFNQIKAGWETHRVCLLWGITGSGKTMVYVRLLEEIIRQNGQALYMLPEIALTSQLIRRLQKYFGGYIAVYHSRFNPQERVELWNRVKSGEIKIILGARSSLFLPFNNLQLIIADEEHDSSFKQHDPAPRYHARDAAIYYAHVIQARVLLGSATPSLETFYNAKQGKYALVHLSERYGEGVLPEITILKKSNDDGRRAAFIGEAMLEALRECITNNRQAIVFQNRRGYVPYMSCEVCGWIPQCAHCDVTLTYHKTKQSLVCHYCAAEYPVLHTCPACGHTKFSNRNFGTERLEERLAELLPGVQVARMDYDTTRGKQQHDQMIKAFEQKRIQVLAGTQMIVKGLDFEAVQLVAVPDADNILFHADFRVYERAFQLLEQVSGRAGRKEGNGKVLIQASQSHHPVLQFLQEHNYLAFYEWEIDNRKRFSYPPFVRLVHLTIRHRQKHIAEEAATMLAKNLVIEEVELTGPAQPPVGRVRNKYIWQVMLKLPKENRTIISLKNALQEQIGKLHFEKRYRGIVVEINVDA